MKILFLDGLGSNPTGLKPKFLRDHGFEVLYPILPEWDFEDAVRIAQEACAESHPDVIVGYSRGGAVALNIDSEETPLVLLTPAWTFLGAATTTKPGTLILHSERDVLVPLGGSRELLSNSGLAGSALRVAGEEHDMDDQEALQAMLEACEEAVLQGKAGGNREE